MVSVCRAVGLMAVVALRCRCVDVLPCRRGIVWFCRGVAWLRCFVGLLVCWLMVLLCAVSLCRVVVTCCWYAVWRRGVSVCYVDSLSCCLVVLLLCCFADVVSIACWFVGSL